MKKIFNIALILLMTITVASCDKESKTEEKAKGTIGEFMSKKVKTEKVKLRKHIQQINVIGKVDPAPDYSVEIPAYVNGFVNSVNTLPGDFVKKGDVLAIIQSSDIADINNQLLATKAELRKEEKEFAVAKDMFEDELISKAEYLSAKAELEMAKAEYNSVKESIRLIGKSNKSILTIVAPIDGVITEQNIKKYSRITDDFEGNMFTISNLDVVHVNLNIFESDIAKIKEGMSVNVKAQAYPDMVFKGEINRIMKVLDPEEKTMKARVVIDNKEKSLLPEMLTSAWIDISKNEEIVAVPSESVLFSEGNYLVIVHEKGEYSIRIIEINNRNKEFSFIKQGLKVNEEVVTDYALLMYNKLVNERLQ